MKQGEGATSKRTHFVLYYSVVFLNEIITSKLPILRSFLKEGGAESYEGVTVNYVKGQQAVLKVYDADTGAELEQVVLQHLPTLESMHQAMRDAGFQLKPEAERRQLQETARRNQAELRAIHHRRNEYMHKRDFYVGEFREWIVQQSPLEEEGRTWKYRALAKSDPFVKFLEDNYDRINQKEQAYLKADLLESARRFLEQQEEKNEV